MISLLAVQVDLLRLWVNLIVSTDHPYHLSDILLIGESLKDYSESWELSVSHVIIPTEDRKSILWLEHKGNWRVVNYDNIIHWSA
jgi:hypothetical protein